MSELSFLLQLLLEHKLPRPTKVAITDRIKEIEVGRTQPAQAIHVQRPPRTAQSPSTQRILDEMAAEQGIETVPVVSNQAIDEMPAVIAQTPAAVAALNARNEAIRIATSGKEEKGRTSPRKF